MPEKINSNYSASFQQFVDFADKAYAAHKEDTFARFKGMTQEDYQGSFASFLRSSEMKAANDEVRALFLKTVADMFGGEKYIPDLVRDNMKLEDFGKGKPLTARRIKLVKTAIDLLGGGKFAGGASVDKARSMGYLPHELPKLARVANLYQLATNCTDAEAEAAALDPSSNARRLYNYGGRFTRNAEGFRTGLALMEDFKAWFTGVCADRNTGKGSVTARNYSPQVSGLSGMVGAEKFIFEELAFNEGITLDAQDKEAVFGMAQNPATRFLLRSLANGQFRSLAQMPHEKRRLLFAVSDLFHPLPADGKGVKTIGQSGIFIGRVMKHADELAALQSAGRLTRQAAFDILYPDIVNKGKRDAAAADTLEDMLVERLDNSQIIRATKILADTGATFAEVLDSMAHNRPLPRAPHMASVGGSLEGYGMKGEAGIKSMCGDIYRPSIPILKATNKAPEGVRLRYVFRFADETLECGGTSEAKAKPVMDRISAKLRELCTAAHPGQLDSVALALGQGQLGQLSCLSEYGLDVNEHIPVEYTIAKDADTGAISVFIKEPENFPVKFNWTVTVDVDGTVTSTPMRIDHGQYEAEAMTHAGSIAAKVPGNDRAAAEAVIRDALAHCGDDFDLKGLVSKYIDKLSITGAGELRTPEQIKAKIDALRANLAEIRATSHGDPAAEKAGIVFLDTLGAQSVPRGMIGRIVQASLTAEPGEYAKVTPASTPQQLFQAVVDMYKAVEKVLRDVHFTETFNESPELLAGRAYIASLVFTRFPPAKLQAADDAFRGETARKVLALVNKIMVGDYPPKTGPLTEDQRNAIDMQCSSLGLFFGLYNLAAETVLGRIGAPYEDFKGPIDKNALGHKDIFRVVLALADDQIATTAEENRQNENIDAAFEPAKAHAPNAYAKAGEGNAEQVDELINAALVRCAANTDALNVVANNMDKLLVTSTAQLRSIEDVREQASAIAANFAELQAFSQGNQAIYEAGKRLLASMGGKALPPGTIGKLIRAASNTKIDAIRKLSPRSSGPDIHRAVTQFRDNIVEAMNASGAEEATVGADEKQPCRNFIAAIMMNHCGERTLHAMRGAFEGETAGKLLVLYGAIANGDFNQGLEQETAVRLEDESGSHMSHLAALKDAIDLADDGHAGMGLVPFSQNLNADEIGGPDIFNDLVAIASR